MLNILSADALLLQRFQDAPCYGEIVAVFRHAVSFSLQAPACLGTLLTETSDNGPLGLRVNLVNFDALALAPNTPLFIDHQSIRFGETRIALAGAIPWEPTLPKYPKELTCLHHNLYTLLPRLIPNLLPATPAAEAREGAPTPTNSVFEKEAQRLLVLRTQALLNALQSNEIDTAYSNAIGLLGLGLGLTPSGDDILLGLFSIAHLRDSPLGALKTITHAIADEAYKRTHYLSAASLEAAASGRIRDRITHCIEALCYGTPKDVEIKLSALLTIGSSSGRDIAYGIIEGLKSALLSPQ